MSAPQLGVPWYMAWNPAPQEGRLNLWYFPLLNLTVVVWVPIRSFLFPSYKTPFGSFFSLSCRRAILLVLRWSPARAILYIAVVLMSSWREVSPISSHSAAMISLHGEVSKLFSNANNFLSLTSKFLKNSLVMKCYRNLGFQIVDWILNSLKFHNIIWKWLQQHGWI